MPQKYKDNRNCSYYHSLLSALKIVVNSSTGHGQKWWKQENHDTLCNMALIVIGQKYNDSRNYNYYTIKSKTNCPVSK